MRDIYYDPSLENMDEENEIVENDDFDTHYYDEHEDEFKEGWDD